LSKDKSREDETALWQAAMKGVRRLKKPATIAEPASVSASESRAKPKPRLLGKAAGPRPRVSAAPDPLEHGRATGLDRRSAERLRRGRLPIDGRLDLHGLTQIEAAERLAEFIAGGEAAGKRCLLVITGKGLARDGGGILREQVPRWLNQPPNRGRVLAFDYAQAQHGGMGALYVLLKRRREP
jgi:DNA-nicking Smr family endonuclease